MYRKVDLEIWRDDKFSRLSAPPPSAQFLWMYLLTGKFSTAMPGLVIAKPDEIFGAIGWPRNEHALSQGAQDHADAARLSLKDEGFSEGAPHGRAAFNEIVTLGMIEVDETAGLIWLPNAMRRNPPQSINNVASWRKAFGKAPQCPLREAIGEATRQYLRTKSRSDSWLRVWDGERLLGNINNLRRGSRQPTGQPTGEATPTQGNRVTGYIKNSSTPNTVPLSGDSVSGKGEGDPFAPPSKPARKRAKPVPWGKYQEFIAAFQSLFVAARGTKPSWGEKQGAQVKNLLRRGGGLPDALARSKRMFEMAAKGWPDSPDLGTLVSCWDKFAPPVKPVVGGGKLESHEYGNGEVDL